jgi:hypothetical protein
MGRWVICAVVLAWAVTGCSGAADDHGPRESLASVTQAASTCKNYDGYTAALAEATIDCRGSIGPNDYIPGPASDFWKGASTDTIVLVPTFRGCPAEPTPPDGQDSAFTRIRRILSLQLTDGQNRVEASRIAAVCIRDAYLSAAKALQANGVAVCPNWHKQFVGGNPVRGWNRVKPPLNPTHPPQVVAAASRMPRPHMADPINPNDVAHLVVNRPDRGTGFRFPKEYFFYTVSFDNQTAPPEQKGCTTALSCARQCSTLWEGFLVGRFGKYLVGDPYWWLDPTDYGGFDQWNDPYNRVNGFYHPMSLAGDDRPGEIYGDFARAAYDEATVDTTTDAELCTFWDGSGDRMARLIQDKLLDDPSTWLSRCEPYPATSAPIVF